MDKKENQLPQFGLCLNNEGYSASLETGKLYRVLPDDEIKSQGYLRIIDESGEEYAYASDRFYLVHLPTAVEEALLAVSQV